MSHKLKVTYAQAYLARDTYMKVAKMNGCFISLLNENDPVAQNISGHAHTNYFTNTHEIELVDRLRPSEPKSPFSREPYYVSDYDFYRMTHTPFHEIQHINQAKQYLPDQDKLPCAIGLTTGFLSGDMYHAVYKNMPHEIDAFRAGDKMAYSIFSTRFVDNTHMKSQKEIDQIFVQCVNQRVHTSWGMHPLTDAVASRKSYFTEPQEIFNAYDEAMANFHKTKPYEYKESDSPELLNQFLYKNPFKRDQLKQQWDKCQSLGDQLVFMSQLTCTGHEQLVQQMPILRQLPELPISKETQARLHYSIHQRYYPEPSQLDDISPLIDTSKSASRSLPDISNIKDSNTHNLNYGLGD